MIHQLHLTEPLKVYMVYHHQNQKNVICQPLIEAINIEKYLDNIELVVVGGESYKNARPLNYDWVLSLREQRITKKCKF